MTATLLAQKFYSDFFYSNNYIARLGDQTTLQDLNRCELELLETIDYRITVDESDLIETASVLNQALDQDFHIS